MRMEKIAKYVNTEMSRYIDAYYDRVIQLQNIYIYIRGILELEDVEITSIVMYIRWRS